MSDSKYPPETIHERIKFLRTMKGYKSATEAAKAFGWTVSTYLGYENGDREPSKKMAHKIADAFGVGLNYLLIGEGLIYGDSDETFSIPIIGDIVDHGEISPSEKSLPVEGYSQALTMSPVLDGTIAVRVQGLAMWPRYDQGDLLGFVRTGQNPNHLPDGCEAVVRLRDGRRTVKKVFRSERDGLHHLHSHNAPPILNQVLVWSALVTSIIRSTNVLHLDHSPEARERRRKRIARTAQEDFFGELNLTRFEEDDT